MESSVNLCISFNEIFFAVVSRLNFSKLRLEFLKIKKMCQIELCGITQIHKLAYIHNEGKGTSHLIFN